jgi:hypothetical protein
LAYGRGMDGVPDIVRPAEWQVDAELVEQPHLGGLRLELECFSVFSGGADGEGKLAPDAEGRLIGEQRQHLLELEHPECVVVHADKRRPALGGEPQDSIPTRPGQYACAIDLI